MASNISNERSELQEDQEKLQVALDLDLDLHNQWETYSVEDDDDEDDDDDDEQLLIDLDNEYQSSEQTGRSQSPSFVGSASQSQSIIIEDDESGEPVPRPNIALPSHEDVTEQRADPHKTLALNRALQGILEEHIEAIATALEENKEKQEKLEEDAADFSGKREKVGRVKSVFRAPYFRHNLSYPPSNEDLALKKQSSHYDNTLVENMKEARKFKRTQRIMLRDAVIEDCLEQILKPVITKMESELAKRDKISETLDRLRSDLDNEKKTLEELERKQQKGNSDSHKEMIREVKATVTMLEAKARETEKELKQCREEIQKQEHEITEKRNIPEDELLASVDPEKVDWMKIAKMNFGGLSTWVDCQKAWENFVCPKVNSDPWSREEDKQLMELVKKSETRDWREISKEIGNGRTAYQCFTRFQRNFNSELKPRLWTEEEDERLISRTNSVKEDMGFYGWSKVSALMDGRSPMECMFRFTRIDPSQTHGRWTQKEDAKLMAAVEMVGSRWSKVAKLIGTRNMVQCRERYMNCLAPSINFTHFTYDEDVKLLKLYKEMGPAWAKMVPLFKGRTDAMLLGRYRQLLKWQEEVEWFEKQTPRTQEMLQGKNLPVAERKKLETKTKDYMSYQLGITRQDYRRQELDRQNGVDPTLIPARPPRHLKTHRFGSVSTKDGMAKWYWKLQFHQHLSDKVHQLVEKEAQKKKTKKSKHPPRLEEEVTAEIIEKSAEDTMKEANKFKLPSGSKTQMKKIQAALNKVFLSEGSFSVQEILNVSSKPEKKKKFQQHLSVLLGQLKSVLRRRTRPLSRVGRSRRFFERDPRPARVIEEELDELDHLVPLMLMKALGTNLHYLHNSAKLRCLEFQEQIARLPTWDNDPEFRGEEKSILDAIKIQEAKNSITETTKQQRVGLLNQKLKALRKIYKEKYYMNKRIIENRMSAFQDDVDFFTSLMDEVREAEVDGSLSSVVCGPRISLENQFEVEGAPTLPSSSVQLHCTDAAIASLSKDLTSSSSVPLQPCTDATVASSSKDPISSSVQLHSTDATVDSTNKNSTASSSSSSSSSSLSSSASTIGASHDEVQPSTSASKENDFTPDFEKLQDKSSAQGTTDNSFAVPTAPAPRKRQRSRSRFSSRLCQIEPEMKKVKLLTQEEIAQEKEKLLPLKKKIYTNLPLLPPNANTLLSLRTLLLRRLDLIQTAGKLYKPERYTKKGLHQSDTDFSEEHEASTRQQSEGGSVAARQVVSGAWFQPSSDKQLSAEASRFQGFVNKKETSPPSRPARPHKFDTTVEGQPSISPRRHKNFPERLPSVFPLETNFYPLDISGQPGFSQSQTSINTLDLDIKPFVVQTPRPKLKKNQVPSSYEVIMAPAGKRGPFALPSNKELAVHKMGNSTEVSKQDDGHFQSNCETSSVISSNFSGIHANSDRSTHVSVDRSGDDDSDNVSVCETRVGGAGDSSVIVNETESVSSNSSTHNGSDTVAIDTTAFYNKEAGQRHKYNDEPVLIDNTDAMDDSLSVNSESNTDVYRVREESRVSSGQSNTNANTDRENRTLSDSTISGEGDVRRQGHHYISSNAMETSSFHSRHNINPVAIDDNDEEEVAATVQIEKSGDQPSIIITVSNEDNPTNCPNPRVLRQNNSGTSSPINVDPHHDKNTVVSDNDMNCVSQLISMHVAERQRNQFSDLMNEDHSDPSVTISNIKESEPHSSSQAWNIPDLSRIQHQGRSLASNSNVVLVQVDKKSGHIVHLKQQDKDNNIYKVIESKPQQDVEDCLANHKAAVERAKRIERMKLRKQQVPDYMQAIRQTDEYKLLLARFRSMFMWPVLVSTIQPSPVNKGNMNMCPGQSQEGQEQPGDRAKKSAKTRRSLKERKHMQAMREAASVARQDRKKVQMEENQPGSGARERTDVEPPESTGGQQPDLLSSERGGEGTAGTKEDSEAAGPSQDADTSKENMAEARGDSPARRKRGRPAGSKNKKYVMTPIERPKRNVRQVKEAAAAEPVKDPPKVIPKWWKDAVLAAMVSKRTLEVDGEDDEEVDIADDEDFIDKGNYSDDEWVQEMKMEKKK